jgi:valine--pyruvate aminotransferase
LELSKFGQKYTRDAGILQLMDDLGNALSVNKDMLMLGGGNPGRVPEFQDIIRKRLSAILKDKEKFHRLIGIYDPPEGNPEIIDSLVLFFKNQFGWKIRRENICITNGSQSAFFMLFNMLTGEYDDGSFRKIQFPLTPEYIGYTDIGLRDDIFIASRPRIEIIEENLFKYYIDFENFKVHDKTSAICVSRPTNPTGNVLTDDEIYNLDKIAKSHQVPLIIDNAYGIPFPHIVYEDITPVWNENIILSMSLSKIGLPSVRNGIIIADEKIVQALSRINAIINLATGSVGSMLVNTLIRNGEIVTISKDIVRPFYQRKMEKAVQWLMEDLEGIDFKIHKPEGAMFLWLWFEGLPVKNIELYEKLKQKGVLVVSGHYFFPGFPDEWQHKNECIRITYSQDDEVVRRGIKIIAEEVKKLY